MVGAPALTLRPVGIIQKLLNWLLTAFFRPLFSAPLSVPPFSVPLLMLSLKCLVTPPPRSPALGLADRRRRDRQHRRQPHPRRRGYVGTNAHPACGLTR